MLLPKDPPYLEGLNSFYLNFEKFIEHLQGDIGSGCVYCQAENQEILVYFDEREAIRGVIQRKGKRALISKGVGGVVQELLTRNFQIRIYYLDSASIFYWAELPHFSRNKNHVTSKEISLLDLCIRFQKMKFSGFVDITLENHEDSVLLFFNKGQRCGGSCSWGKGEISFSGDDYMRLLTSIEEADMATFDIGRFAADEAPLLQEVSLNKTSDEPNEQQFWSNLDTALKEILILYAMIFGQKSKNDPIVVLKQQFLDSIDEYPYLDPFANFFKLSGDGEFQFSPSVNRKEVASGIISCVWRVIFDHKLEEKFRTAVENWEYTSVLEKQGITVLC